MTQAWFKALAAALVGLIALPAWASHIDPTGVWLLEKNKVAIQIYQCDDGFCGRIAWIKEPLDDNGRPWRDKYNPDAALRNRPLCGIEVLSGLRPAGHDQWDGGRIYNPRDGQVYAAAVRAVAPDTIEVHGYVGIPLFGKTRTLTRVGRIAARVADPFVDLSTAAQKGFGQSQVAGLIDIDRGFREGQFDGPGCSPNQARQATHRGVQG